MKSSKVGLALDTTEKNQVTFEVRNTLFLCAFAHFILIYAILTWCHVSIGRSSLPFHRLGDPKREYLFLSSKG